MEWNCMTKLNAVKAIFKKWKKHRLTLYGKNVIIKSLGGSGLSFLFSVLPSPDEHFFKEYDAALTDFLWDSSTTKIKKDTLFKSFENSGINLLDLRSFDKALKIKWIKYITDKAENSLSILMSKDITKLKDIIWKGNISYSDIKKVTSIKNVFLGSVLGAWTTVKYEKLTSPKKEVLLKQCLWLNSYIRVQNKPVFYKTMFEKGIVNLQDIMKNNCVFLTYRELCVKFDCVFNIMEYNSLLSAIPWKRILSAETDASKPIDTVSYENLIHDNKSCRKTYTGVPTSQGSWPAEFSDVNFDPALWNKIYKHIYFSSSNNILKNFQLKLIHRCLPRKRILWRSGKVDSPNCNFCNTVNDDIIHIYYSCNVSKEFWSKVATYTHLIMPNVTVLNQFDIIFGPISFENELLSFIVLAAKHHIHRSYWSHRSPNIDVFKTLLDKYEYIERLLALQNDTLIKHNEKWEAYEKQL